MKISAIFKSALLLSTLVVAGAAHAETPLEQALECQSPETISGHVLWIKVAPSKLNTIEIKAYEIFKSDFIAQSVRTQLTAEPVSLEWVPNELRYRETNLADAQKTLGLKLRFWWLTTALFCEPPLKRNFR